MPTRGDAVRRGGMTRYLAQELGAVRAFEARRATGHDVSTRELECHLVLLTLGGAVRRADELAAIWNSHPQHRAVLILIDPDRAAVSHGESTRQI